ncbi:MULTISPECIES: hypothetical protein [Haloferax]|uniref:Uncharacterized protein n=1 Tax=Haloferax marinum TaxID=2666143 RepID=A0A6A8GAR2_9EURY|nr:MULTISPECIES: hypothetical protein [Haloferax]KAB1198699.1 hypothetical protein Hfx1150_14695 [Haloferax sp. CBA1150]MRW97815.1 hypothetical protein [Haloferax marinum]
MDADNQFEDPIAAALLSDSIYESLRVRRRSLFKQPLSRKLAWQSLILGSLAMVLPLAMAFPESTQALFPAGDPLTSTPKILLLGAYAGIIEALAAVALVYVGYRRIRHGESLTEQQAGRLLDIEEMASLFSLVTGPFAVLAFDGVFLLGLGGQDTMASFFAVGGDNPFAATTIPVSLLEVTVAAGVLAVLVFAVSRLFERRLHC